MIISGYVSICLNMPEYAWIWLNLSEWLLFYISPFPRLFYNPFSTSTHGYLFEHLQRTIFCETVFLKMQNFVFSVAGGSISESWYTLLVFCFFIQNLSRNHLKSYPTFVKLLTSIVQLPVVWNHYLLYTNIG